MKGSVKRLRGLLGMNTECVDPSEEEVLVCCVLPWSFPARVSCPMLRFIEEEDRQSANSRM